MRSIRLLLVSGPTTSIGLYPAAVVATRHQVLAKSIGLFAWTGRKRDQAVPNALLPHVDGLQLALLARQEVWKACLQFAKRALCFRLLLVGEQDCNELGILGICRQRRNDLVDPSRNLLLLDRGGTRYITAPIQGSFLWSPWRWA